jgi:hypothetical protein
MHRSSKPGERVREALDFVPANRALARMPYFFKRSGADEVSRNLLR